MGSLKQFVHVYESDGEPAVAACRGLRNSLTTDTAEGPKVMLRRLKKDHLPGLPKLWVHRFEESMPPMQATAYTAAVRRAKGEGADKGMMLRALHEMRTVSLHPDLAGAQSAEEFIVNSARVARMMDILDEIQAQGEK